MPASQSFRRWAAPAARASGPVPPFAPGPIPWRSEPGIGARGKIGVPSSSSRRQRPASARLFSSASSAAAGTPAPAHTARTRRSHSAGGAKKASRAQNAEGGMRSSNSPAWAVTATRCVSCSEGSSRTQSPVATRGTPSVRAAAVRCPRAARSPARPRTPIQSPPPAPSARDAAVPVERPSAGRAPRAAGTPAASSVAARPADSTTT